jgi:hypothetical protein
MTITVCSCLSKDVTELGKHGTRNSEKKMQLRGGDFVGWVGSFQKKSNPHGHTFGAVHTPYFTEQFKAMPSKSTESIGSSLLESNAIY